MTKIFVEFEEEHKICDVGDHVEEVNRIDQKITKPRETKNVVVALGYVFRLNKYDMHVDHELRYSANKIDEERVNDELVGIGHGLVDIFEPFVKAFVFGIALLYQTLLLGRQVTSHYDIELEIDHKVDQEQHKVVHDVVEYVDDQDCHLVSYPHYDELWVLWALLRRLQRHILKAFANAGQEAENEDEW